MLRLAVIDIGTVSVRLAIADVSEPQPRCVYREANICNLGEGVAVSGSIQHEAIERVCECVDAYLAHAREHNANYVVCSLTSAARDARNAVDLLAELSLKNLVPQVITGDTEAALAYMGAVQDFEDEQILVCDSGGGSTELACGSYAVSRLSLPFVRSIPVGCRRLTERFLQEHDPPTGEELRCAHEACRQSFEELRQFNVDKLVCCGGTATSLVSMTLELETYDSSAVHLCELSCDDVAKLEEEMAILTQHQRGFVVGLQPQRASVILGGIVVLAELMDAARVLTMTVTENDLLSGLTMVAGMVVNGQDSPISWEPLPVQLR